MAAAFIVLGILGGLALGLRFLLWVVCYTIVHGHLPMRRSRAILRVLRQRIPRRRT